MADVDAGIAYLDRVSKFAVAEHQEIYHVCRGMLQAMREPSVNGYNCEKKTIEINREIAELWLRGEDSDGEMVDEVKHALEAK